MTEINANNVVSEPQHVGTSDAIPLRGHQACRRSGVADDRRWAKIDRRV